MEKEALLKDYNALKYEVVHDVYRCIEIVSIPTYRDQKLVPMYPMVNFYHFDYEKVKPVPPKPKNPPKDSEEKPVRKSPAKGKRARVISVDSEEEKEAPAKARSFKKKKVVKVDDDEEEDEEDREESSKEDEGAEDGADDDEDQEQPSSPAKVMSMRRTRFPDVPFTVCCACCRMMNLSGVAIAKRWRRCVSTANVNLV